MEKLLTHFPLPYLQDFSFVEGLIQSLYRITDYKFSVIFNGSKGYLSNIQIECEGTQGEENRIFVERLRNADGSFKKIRVNIFHSEENGLRVSTGKDKPRKTSVKKCNSNCGMNYCDDNGCIERKRVLTNPADNLNS